MESAGKRLRTRTDIGKDIERCLDDLKITHGKEIVILYTYSVMPCATIAGHINIAMPCRRTEIPLKKVRVYISFGSKTEIERRNNPRV